MLTLDALDASAAQGGTTAAIARQVQAAERLTATLSKAAKACGYQLDKLEAAAGG